MHRHCTECHPPLLNHPACSQVCLLAAQNLKLWHARLALRYSKEFMHVAIIDGIGDKSTWSIVSNMSVKSLLAQNISSAATPVSSTTADTILISQMNRSSEMTGIRVTIVKVLVTELRMKTKITSPRSPCRREQVETHKRCIQIQHHLRLGWWQKG